MTEETTGGAPELEQPPEAPGAPETADPTPTTPEDGAADPGESESVGGELGWGAGVAVGGGAVEEASKDTSSSRSELEAPEGGQDVNEAPPSLEDLGKLCESAHRDAAGAKWGCSRDLGHAGPCAYSLELEAPTG